MKLLIGLEYEVLFPFFLFLFSRDCSPPPCFSNIQNIKKQQVHSDKPLSSAASPDCRPRDQYNNNLNKI